MKIQFSRRFDRDLDRLYDFLIENDASRKTAHRAIAAIRERAYSLSTHPRRGTPLHDALGRYESHIKFGKSGYTLRYVPDDATNTVYVLRVWHDREER